MIPAGVTHRLVDTGEVKLHVAELGQGPLVLLLHGFPECWVSWRNQLPALAAAGYRVVAPDLRGYGGSDKPRGIRAYRLEALARDIEGLIGALGETRAHVVGHDWGGAVAWQLAMQAPAKIGRLAILNVPHPRRMLQGLRTLRQLKKSWYFFFFQLPFLPEARMSHDHFALIRNLFRYHPARRAAYDESDIDEIIAALSQPGTATAALNYYRAALRHPPAVKRIELPVLVLWGEQDKNLGRELAAPEAGWVPSARVVRIADAGHFVQADAPDRVNRELIQWLKAEGA